MKTLFQFFKYSKKAINFYFSVFICFGYEIIEKSYLLTNISGQQELELTIKTSDERPLVNPVFVIRGIDKKVASNF